MINYGWIDAHCHLADKKILANLKTEIHEAKQMGTTCLISSALCPEEYKLIEDDTFKSISEKNKISIKWAAGIHPYYEYSSEKYFDHLLRLCDTKKIVAIGEIGLDARNEECNWQKKMLLMQLDLAANYDLPVVFHTVRKYYELHKILKKNFPKVRGMLHAFNASNEIFETLSKYDLAFSMNANLAKSNVINKIMKREFFFLETDAPFMRPRELAEDFNHLRNLEWVINKVSRQTGIDQNKLMKMQYKSYSRLFG